MAQELEYTCRQYGSNERQRVAVWELRAPAQGPWIVFIHGGAWRDPRNTPHDFAPSIDHLLGHRAPVGGFASLDYRLSPSDAFPQVPADTPESERRTARHPDHVHDVRAALRLLAAEHRVADHGYVLVGHSAGATLALQLLMGFGDDGESPPVPLPAAIVGISGIYDLIALNRRRDGAYASFIAAAFGPDQDAWSAASPACFAGSFRDRWAGTALLAHSPDDTLVDAAETDSMAAKLVRDGVDVSVRKDLSGEHDIVWQDGEQVALLVRQVLVHLREEATTK